MTTQTVLTSGTAAMPRVNLMPPEIAEAARFKQVQAGMGAAVLVSAVIVGGLYVHAKSQVSGARQQVTDAQNQQTALQSKLSGLQNVSQTYSDVQAKQALLNQAMGQEVRWSYVLNDLAIRIPNNVFLTDATATEATAGAPAGSAATTSTTDPDSIGTITFTGVAFKHDDVATWLNALSREKGFVDPTFTNSTEGLIGTRKIVNFGSSAQLTTDALSNRYTTKAGS